MNLVWMKQNQMGWERGTETNNLHDAKEMTAMMNKNKAR
jgi:hypothetical protein